MAIRRELGKSPATESFLFSIKSTSSNGMVSCHIRPKSKIEHRVNPEYLAVKINVSFGEIHASL